MIKKLFTQKTEDTFIQFFRYFFVGGISALVDLGSFYVFVKLLNIDYRVAVFLSFTCGTLTNFFLSNAFVFDRKTLSMLSACVRHYGSSLGGLVTNEIVMILLISVAHFPKIMIAKVIATGCAFVVNFTLIKFYAFNDRVNIFKKVKELFL